MSIEIIIEVRTLDCKRLNEDNERFCKRWNVGQSDNVTSIESLPDGQVCKKRIGGAHLSPSIKQMMNELSIITECE